FQVEAGDGHTRATLLKLVALLHDVAKPETRTVEPDGRIRFLGHHILGAERVQRIAERLRLGSRGVRLLALMVENHLRPAALSGDTDDMPTRRALFRDFRDAAAAAMDTLYLNAADFMAAR
ncbi:MAG: HD domain-containing protein, partial [Chloroflexota bacterium]